MVWLQNVISRVRCLCETDDRVRVLVNGRYTRYDGFLSFSLKNAKNVRMRMSISSRLVSGCVIVGYSSMEAFFLSNSKIMLI